VRKTGFSQVHLGLSGGVDSAVVACLAADALGPFNVTGIAMPGPFSQPDSLTLAEQLAKNLGLSFYKVPIVEMYDKVAGDLSKAFGNAPFGIMNENIQARLRGLTLMSYSNLNQS